MSSHFPALLLCWQLQNIIVLLSACFLLGPSVCLAEVLLLVTPDCMYMGTRIQASFIMCHSLRCREWMLPSFGIS